jgi:hypothetical protein
MLFFILLGGSAFTLRGIWGHNLGGAVMGILIGLGLGIVFDLPLILTLEKTFWLAFMWALGAFIGWANYKTFQRFIWGYLFYAAIPNIIIALYLFSGNLIAQLLIIFVGSIGMGLGFGLSYPLLNSVRLWMEKRYKLTQNNDMKINWGDNPLVPGEISHIFIFHFDTWKVLLEYTAGLLYGCSMLIILNAYPMALKSTDYVLNGWHYLINSILLVIIPMGLAFGVINEKRIHHGWQHPEDILVWSMEKAKKFKLLILSSIITWGTILLSFMNYFMDITLLFLIFYWITNILAKFYNPIRAKMFQADCLLDTWVGFVLTILLL